ncbi:nuclear transport factor 2 family protein [Sedimentibacter sp. zth1]|uniref:nuclear transport factor 2 family protein n=1 Tax=Sedimentibacter sp. zth1 TaxID=2816908 RepID=UPI001A92AA19|nr:nuclear transport factor 2 family protein [Sedimentibacter sp. zth1]QSX05914.1 nuclear transport factor 2 family protein [Sedimentibacter sp. zth1]QSX06678.1 nuclear transport factor 2 family protein [Sedimentibacter sp. zth1]
MNRKELLMSFWCDVANQNVEALKNYFAPNAHVRWHNTNEQFTTEEFIIANCEYPGDWQGEVERIELVEDKAITATRVWLKDNSASFHVTSFFKFQGDKIFFIDEYWGDDGIAPQWRLDKNIGKPIK